MPFWQVRHTSPLAGGCSRVKGSSECTSPAWSSPQLWDLGHPRESWPKTGHEELSRAQRDDLEAWVVLRSWSGNCRALSPVCSQLGSVREVSVSKTPLTPLHLPNAAHGSHQEVSRAPCQFTPQPCAFSNHLSPWLILNPPLFSNTCAFADVKAGVSAAPQARPSLPRNSNPIQDQPCRS